jgi:dolichyl-phosphate beta-glucosyltransferase
MDPTSSFKLSIIIPAYNEESRLGRTLGRLYEYFNGRGASPDSFEIIVVDDGSTDNTVRTAQEWSLKIPSVRVVSNGQNRGKGYSVRHGMLEARGRIGLFSDADLSTPIEESQKLIAAICAGNDVAIGSRGLDRSLISVRQSKLREVAGMVFNGFVRLITGLPFVDTQCGFKAFALQQARVIFEQQRIERFGFDPEILFLAKRHGLQSTEIPVRWAHDPATKVSVLRDSLRMLRDLVTIRLNAVIGRYPKTAAGSSAVVRSEIS